MPRREVVHTETAQRMLEVRRWVLHIPLLNCAKLRVPEAVQGSCRVRAEWVQSGCTVGAEWVQSGCRAGAAWAQGGYNRNPNPNPKP